MEIGFGLSVSVFINTTLLPSKESNKNLSTLVEERLAKHSTIAMTEKTHQMRNMLVSGGDSLESHIIIIFLIFISRYIFHET